VLAEVFRSHHASFVRTAYLLLGDAGAAEEAVQDAFLHAFRTIEQRGEPEFAVAYMRRAVVNTCRSRLRRLGLARRRPPTPSPHAASAEEAAVVHAEHGEVMEGLRRLSPRQRECLVLRYYGDLSEAQIADALGISTGAVKSHVHRGIQALGKVLDR
jgi:RNA polymerase sigma-70 factor (sigma-E family)